MRTVVPGAAPGRCRRTGRAEEERLVLDDRSAEAGPGLVALEVRGLGQAAGLFEVGERVEPAGPVVVPGVAAELLVPDFVITLIWAPLLRPNSAL